MRKSYPATISGDRITWLEEIPPEILKGKPLKVIVTVRESNISGRRPVGLAAGELIVPDDFDEPLPDNVLNEFEK